MCVWVSLQKAFFVFILALLLKSFVQKKVEEETDKIKKQRNQNQTSNSNKTTSNGSRGSKKE